MTLDCSLIFWVIVFGGLLCINLVSVVIAARYCEIYVYFASFHIQNDTTSTSIGHRHKSVIPRCYSKFTSNVGMSDGCTITLQRKYAKL